MVVGVRIELRWRYWRLEGIKGLYAGIGRDCCCGSRVGVAKVIVVLRCEFLDGSRVKETLGFGGRRSGRSDASRSKDGGARSLGGQGRFLASGLAHNAGGSKGRGVPVEGLLAHVGAAASVVVVMYIIAVGRMVVVEIAARILVAAFAIDQDVSTECVFVCCKKRETRVSASIREGFKETRGQR